MKKYGIFLIRKNGKIEGIIKTNNDLNLSEKSFTVIKHLNQVDLTLKIIKKSFPKLLKTGVKIVPIRVTRKKYTIPIKINDLNRMYYNTYNTCTFEIENKIERRKRKLDKINI